MNVALTALSLAVVFVGAFETCRRCNPVMRVVDHGLVQSAREWWTRRRLRNTLWPHPPCSTCGSHTTCSMTDYSGLSYWQPCGHRRMPRASS